MINIVLYYEEIIWSLEGGKWSDGFSVWELYWFDLVMSLRYGEMLNIDENYVIEFGSKMLEVEECLKKVVVL